MIQIPFWLFLLIALSLWIRWRRREAPAQWHPAHRRKELLLNLLFAYGLAVTYVTQFPMRIWFAAERRVNWHLFAEMRWLFYNPEVAVLNIAGNLLLFMPLGFLVPLLFGKYAGWLRVALLGLLCSVGIEFVQYLTGDRAADVDDLLLNTIGALLGYAVLQIGRRALRT